MLAQGAVEAGPCWDLSAVATFRNVLTPTIVSGLFRYSVPPAAVEFELASGTELRRMFSASDFNQPVSLRELATVWSTSEMFQGARFFNSPLLLEGIGYTGKWTDASSMFDGAYTFNQPIETIGNTSAVTDFGSMFENARAFNQPIGGWDTSAVTNFRSMFADAHSFNQPIGGWDTSSATTMRSMFKASAFNQPIEGWVTSSVIDMGYMFYFNEEFGQELAGWDVRSVTTFVNMFADSRIRHEAVSGGKGFGRACRIHHSWKAQNAVWDPVTARLVADAAELDLSLCAPYLADGALHGDPHLGLAHGGHADFRGCNGCLFDFLSTRDVTVNARLRAATFTLRGSEVHGTFVTEVHVATLNRAKNRWFKASYWAKEVGEGNWGWGALNGSCGGDSFPLFPHHTFACDASSATTAHSSAVFALPEWEVSVKSRPVYARSTRSNWSQDRTTKRSD